MAFINSLKAKVQAQKDLQLRLRVDRRVALQESLVVDHDQTAVFSIEDDTSFLTSHFKTFTLLPYLVGTPEVNVSVRYVYNYLRANQIVDGRELRYEAVLLFLNHDLAFQTRIASTVGMGDTVIQGSKRAFKSLLNQMTNRDYESLYPKLYLLAGAHAEFIDGIRIREEVRAILTNQAEITVEEFRILFTIAVGFTYSRIREETELSFMYCLIGLSKGQSVDNRYMSRKLVAFKSQRPIESSFFLEDIDSDAIVAFHVILKQLMTAEQFPLDTVMIALTKSLALCTNVAVTPMLSHVGFRNLTPILNILKCLIVNSEFPWAAIFLQIKRLAVEMGEVIKVVAILKGNPYATHMLSGTGPAFAMLAYLCTQLLIATGTTSLERYRGVGSEDYTQRDAFDKRGLKQYIQDFINDPDRGCINDPDGKEMQDFSAKHLKWVNSLAGLQELMMTEDAINAEIEEDPVPLPAGAPRMPTPAPSGSGDSDDDDEDNQGGGAARGRTHQARDTNLERRGRSRSRSPNGEPPSKTPRVETPLLSGLYASANQALLNQQSGSEQRLIPVDRALLASINQDDDLDQIYSTSGGNEVEMLDVTPREVSLPLIPELPGVSSPSTSTPLKASGEQSGRQHESDSKSVRKLMQNSNKNIQKATTLSKIAKSGINHINAVGFGKTVIEVRSLTTNELISNCSQFPDLSPSDRTAFLSHFLTNNDDTNQALIDLLMVRSNKLIFGGQ